MKALIAILFATLAIGLVAGCGGGGIPDDVSYRVFKSDEGGRQRSFWIELNKEVSENTLREITIEFRSLQKSENPALNDATDKTVVFFYLPGTDDTNSNAWGNVLISPLGFDKPQVTIFGK